LIELRNISKCYRLAEPVWALKDLSFRVDTGEFVAIMGPSGSGKSTLMNILGCLDKEYTGQYLLEGKDISCLPDGDLADIRNQTIGFIFQSFNLLPQLNARENVELPMIYAGYPAAERRERALALLQQVGLGQRASHMPNQLSGGQCQRVAIARALTCRPRLLLADEPTGNLDSRTGEEIMRLLSDTCKEGMTVVLITHEPEVAAWADRTLYLKDGQLQEIQSVECC